MLGCREEGFNNFKELKEMIEELEILLIRDLSKLANKVDKFEFYLRHELLELMSPNSNTKSHNTTYAFYNDKKLLPKGEGT